MANSGGTSLMFAAGAGHTEAATVLLDAGADVNAKLQATPEFLEQVRHLRTRECELLLYTELNNRKMGDPFFDIAEVYGSVGFN